MLNQNRKSTNQATSFVSFTAAALVIASLLLGASVPPKASAQAKPAPGAGELVVAIRYLLPTGTSHAHLFLYRDDGKLLRQLTSDDTGQDMMPVFAPGGETIVWTREKGTGVREFWQIEPRGKNLKRLQTAPAWYKPAQNQASSTYTSPYFNNADLPPGTPNGDGSQTPGEFPRFRAPNGAIELELREIKNDPNNEIDGPGHGEHFLIRDLKTGRETELGKLPGFDGVYDLLHDKQTGKQHFLWENNLHVAFFGLHIGSTDGDTVYVLDLIKPRLVQLSPNWAAPFPLPGESAFLTRTEVRYVPLGGKGDKTANSSYVERWDAALHKVRFARPNVAALCYGASLFRPGRIPAVVTIAKFD